MTRGGQTKELHGPGPSFTDLPVWRDYEFHLLMERGLQPSSVRLYAGRLHTWHRFLHPTRWEDADARDLARFVARTATAGRHRGQPVTANERRSDIGIIRDLYRWAYRSELLARDPMERVKAPRTPTPVPRDLTLEEVAKLLDHLADERRLTVAVWLGYGCGLRVGEMARLRVKDVQLDGGRPCLRVLNSKGGKSRVVPLPDQVREVLADWLAGQRPNKPVLARQGGPGGWSESDPLAAGTLTDLLGDAMRAAGVGGSAHSLRHSYATRLLEAGRGTNLMTVSKLLGHSSTALTEQVYGAGYRGELDAVAALLPDPHTAVGGGRP
jgi:integrase